MERINHADEIIKSIDKVLAEEATLQDGLEWAVEHGWMSEEESAQCLRLFQRDSLNNLEPPTAP